MISSQFKIFKQTFLSYVVHSYSAFIMNKHLLSNVLFLHIKGYLKLAGLHFKKYILVTVVGYLLLLSPLMTCTMQKQTFFGRGDF